MEGDDRFEGQRGWRESGDEQSKAGRSQTLEGRVQEFLIFILKAVGIIRVFYTGQTESIRCALV